jgi:hypothetical protein
MTSFKNVIRLYAVHIDQSASSISFRVQEIIISWYDHVKLYIAVPQLQMSDQQFSVHLETDIKTSMYYMIIK